MSASKLDTSGVFQPVEIRSSETHLSIPSSDIRVRKSGVEFLARQPVPAWTEMTIELHSPETSKKVQCTGVVVECSGNRHTGYLVCIAFMSLSRQAERHLNEIFTAQSL
ncbi:MAG: hypothetical protein K9N62_05705 [Verrucomicrobia bacterium]|jgi:hypothetical protein|nr:hypothetical protein [Verrucomicrobiota bacterium]